MEYRDRLGITPRFLEASHFGLELHHAIHKAFKAISFIFASVNLKVSNRPPRVVYFLLNLNSVISLTRKLDVNLLGS